MSKDFWLDALERAVRAFAWAFLSSLVIGEGFNAFTDINWVNSLGVGCGAALLSVVASLAAIKLTKTGTASLTNATVTSEYADAVASGRHAAGLRNGPAV